MTTLASVVAGAGLAAAAGASVAGAVAASGVAGASVAGSVHQLAGFDPEQARGAFAIPADHTPFTVLVIGAQGDPAALPEPLYARELAERTRKPLGSFVFGGVWGQPVSLLAGVTQEG